MLQFIRAPAVILYPESGNFVAAGAVVVVWRRGTVVISTGHLLLATDPRLAVTPTGQLR